MAGTKIGRWLRGFVDQIPTLKFCLLSFDPGNTENIRTRIANPMSYSVGRIAAEKETRTSKMESPPPENQDSLSDEDLELIREIKSGKTELFARLVRKYEQRIYTLVFRIVQSREDAEEVANDAFVAAFKKIHTFREESRFYSWLYRIAANHALNRIKYNRRRGAGRKDSIEEMIEKSGDGAVARLGREEDSPLRGALNQEWQNLIEAALEKISPLYRVIVILRDVESQTYEEIAETTGLALGTVKSRLHKGRAILQKMLERYR